MKFKRYMLSLLLISLPALQAKHSWASSDDAGSKQSILPGGCVRPMPEANQPAPAEQAKSSVSVILTQIKAIREAMAFAGVKNADQLVTCNDEQKDFINRYVANSDAFLSLFLPQELRARASTNIPALNDWLEQEGFDIRLSEGIPDTYGVVAILKIALEWKQKARQTSIEYSGQQYSAFELERKKHDCSVFHVEGYAHPIARVVTKNNDTVYFALADAPADDMQLQDKVVKLLAQKKISNADHDSVIVPKVSLDIRKKLEKLLGLVIGDGRIMQAEQQTKFSMDETGARVEDAVALLIERCMPQPAYILNKPFYVWIVRDGMQEPYFAGYITPKDWKNLNDIAVS